MEIKICINGLGGHSIKQRRERTGGINNKNTKHNFSSLDYMNFLSFFSFSSHFFVTDYTNL